MTLRMLLRRTAAKSVTVTLWLMSITASSPATAWRDGGGVLSNVAPLGGCPPQPARAGTVKAATPPNTCRREIIRPTFARDSLMMEFTTPDCPTVEKSAAAESGAFRWVGSAGLTPVVAGPVCVAGSGDRGHRHGFARSAGGRQERSGAGARPAAAARRA